MKKLKITIEGKTYDVTVEVVDEPAASNPRVPVPAIAPPPPKAEAPAAPAQAVAAVAGSDDVPSPLAGTIVRLEVAIGDTVKAGDTLLILEAMKMNTAVAAPRSGTVRTIPVEAGESVREGQTLVTLT